MSHIWPEPEVSKYKEHGCATSDAIYLILSGIVAIVSFVCGYGIAFLIWR